MTCFQYLDNKNECIGYFYNDKLHFKEPDIELSKTWSYHPDIEAKFANLYVEGKNILDIAPLHLKPLWEKLHKKKLAFIKSFKHSKVNLNKHCFYDLVPEYFLFDYNYVKNKITEYVFENYEEPKNYEFLVELSALADKIRKQPLKLNQNQSLLLRAKTKMRYSNYVDYNIFGTVTGRLSTYPDSFPIMTLNKKYRSVIESHNGVLLELDLNAAEIRVFLALLGKEQPEGDIHDWNNDNIFKGSDSRDEAKSRFFSWFYNPNNVDKELEKVYDRDYLLQRYYNGKTLESPFGRTIEVDDFRALSYLIQGASNDIVLRNILKIDKLLGGRKSFISFSLHDSVIIDLHSEDIPLIQELYKLFTETEYGTLVATTKYGPNFGNLKEIR